MIKDLFLLSLVMGLMVLPAAAAEVSVADGLVLEINLNDGWSLHLEPPEAMVREAVAHVAHEAAAANATAEQIEQVARKRLMVNEAIVYHAATGAHLDIDFSALEPGQSAPSAQTLRRSAEYAAGSLKNEEGVAGMTWDVSSTKIKGVDDILLLSADYLQHGHPMTFRGYIGYIEKHWFFIYFTAPGKGPVVLQEMQSMLDHVSVRSAGR